MPVLTANSIQPVSDGLDYGADNLTWIIAPSVIVSSDGGKGVLSLRQGSRLENHGSILSSVDRAVWFFGKDGVIVNAVDGTISGVGGVEVYGTNTSVINDGSIACLGWGAHLGGAAEQLINRGYLHGYDSGVSTGPNAAGAVIQNEGVIDATRDGVILDSLGFTVDISNAGTIAGQECAIWISAGAMHLENSGLLAGDMLAHPLGTDADTILNSGRIKGNVYLGGGNDSFANAGGTSGAIFGQSGADRIIGGGSSDRINGGAGNDVLTGGAGPDHFVFSDALAASTNLDRITDFSVPQDTIDLDHAVFAKLGANGKLAGAFFYKGAHAHDANDHIIYNPTTGALLYDSNGNAAGGEVKFAVLAAHLALTHSDFLVV